MEEKLLNHKKGGKKRKNKYSSLHFLHAMPKDSTCTSLGLETTHPHNWEPLHFFPYISNICLGVFNGSKSKEGGKAQVQGFSSCYCCCYHRKTKSNPSFGLGLEFDNYRKCKLISKSQWQFEQILVVNISHHPYILQTCNSTQITGPTSTNSTRILKAEFFCNC